jgi:hypothetical protein
LAEALEVLEAQRLPVALGLVSGLSETVAPEVERLGRGDAPDDAVDHAGAGSAAPGAWELEEGDVGARVAALVGVEEVVHGRRVLVDRLLDQPKAEHAGVEVDVVLGVGGDCRDVMDALELHGSSSFIRVRLAPGSCGIKHCWLLVGQLLCASRVDGGGRYKCTPRVARGNDSVIAPLGSWTADAARAADDAPGQR